MHETLTQGFSWVCGQDAIHTWTCGGLPLPCCQRCTGLYLGSLAAFVLLNLLRPVMTRPVLWVHGLMLMLMVPFGFHWLPQGALIRGWTGVLFGFGVMAFLRLPLTRRTVCPRSPARTARLCLYWSGLAATLAALAVLHVSAEQSSVVFVSLIPACGALTLLGVAAANIRLGVCGLLRLCRGMTAQVRYE